MTTNSTVNNNNNNSNESYAISDGILIQPSSATTATATAAADLSINDLKQIDIECQMPPSYERVVGASSSAIDLQAGKKNSIFFLLLLIFWIHLWNQMKIKWKIKIWIQKSKDPDLKIKRSLTLMIWIFY